MSENRLLSLLPPPEFNRLTARMTTVTFEQKGFVYRARGPIDYVYFPRTGMLSAVAVMDDGVTAEVAAIGRDGIAGVSAFLGATHSDEQVFCQISTCECRKWSAAEFAAEVAKGGPLRDVVHRYTRAMLTVSARKVACNALHSNDERFALWLLRCRDAVGADEFNLTHEFMATMLGVRRATVSMTASTFQSAGFISYRHGNVKVLNPAGLEEAACECYPTIRDALALPGDTPRARR